MSFPHLFALLLAGLGPRRQRPLPHWLACAFLLSGLLASSLAQATVYTFNGQAVETCSLSNKVYTCPYPAYLDWDDAVVIGSGYTLRVTNNVTVTYNQGLSMQAGSKLIVTGNLNIKAINPPNLKVADNSSIEVGGTFSMGDLRQSLSADVAANAIHLGTDAVTINGNLTSKTSIAIGSYATINGDISGTVVTTASPVTINGKVTASTSFTLASGSKVTGSVDTGSLVLESSEATIDGPAYVNTARLEWHGRVTGTIYCKNGTAKNKCDCVTNNSGYSVNSASGPRCEPPPARAPYRFLVTHDGEGDTCLPERITITACANATCTAPHYAGAVSGQLTGTASGQAATLANFTIGENTGATTVNVTRIASGSLALGVNAAATEATACYRSSNNTNSCSMSFAGGAKLLVEVPDHPASANGIKAVIQAVRANDSQTACVAAFENATYPVAYSCSYAKPKTGTLPLALEGKSLACGAGGASGTAQTISTAFLAQGKAELSLKYADAGEVRLDAHVDTQKGMTASGQGSFVTAPASFLITPPAAGVIRAGAEFTLQVTARNLAGSTTPNFDTGDLAAAAAINHGVGFEVDCHASGGNKGSLSAPASFVDGVAQVKATWSDVGKIDVNASLKNFMATGLNASGSTNNPATAGCDGSVGPFIPAYFRLQLPDTRAFYYSGEPFPLLVSAMNTAGGVTLNYSSTLGLSEAVTLTALDKAGTAFSPAPGSLSNAAVAATAFQNGVASLNGTAMNGATVHKPAYTFATAPTAPTQIRLRAANGKSGAEAVLSASPATAETAMPVIRSGRLRLGNRFGGLKSTLSVPVAAEYWTGRSWLLNSDDVYTVIPHSSFIIKPLVSGMTLERSFASSPVKLAGGAAAFDLRMTAGGPGPVDVAINLGAGLQDNTCVGNTVGMGLQSSGAGIPWLRPLMTGCGASNFARDPYSRVNFGVFTPENRRVIHVREVFN